MKPVRYSLGSYQLWIDVLYLQRTPATVDVPISSAPAHPKRRRVPITIIDNHTTPSPKLPVQTQMKQEPDGLMQAVSSRPLTEAQNRPEARSTSTEHALSSTPPPPGPSTSNARKATTFKGAKEARETQQVRPGGGIFRSNGQHTLFETRPKPSSPSAPPAKPVDPPVVVEGKAPANLPPAPTLPQPVSTQTLESVRIQPPILGTSAPMTLFNFNRAWESTTVPTERWKLLVRVV